MSLWSRPRSRRTHPQATTPRFSVRHGGGLFAALDPVAQRMVDSGQVPVIKASSELGTELPPGTTSLVDYLDGWHSSGSAPQHTRTTIRAV